MKHNKTKINKNRGKNITKKKRKIKKETDLSNSALIVIDAQNKYRYVMKKNEIKNMKKNVEVFKNAGCPVYFTQWSLCKNNNNCTRGHSKESMIYKVIKRINQDVYGLSCDTYEKKDIYKCPSKKCDIIDELKEYSNNKNTFISNNLDSLQINKLKNELIKNKIKKLYITGGWFSYCVLATAYNCVNIHNIYPVVIQDAIFDDINYKKLLPPLIKSWMITAKTKDITNDNTPK